MPPTRSEAALSTLVMRLLDPASTFAEREKLIASLVGKPVAAPVNVERAESTAGGFELAEPLREGRTIIGTVEGTKLKIAVRFPTARTREVENLTPGMFTKVRGVVAGWDSLFERLIVDAS